MRGMELGSSWSAKPETHHGHVRCGGFDSHFPSP